MQILFDVPPSRNFQVENKRDTRRCFSSTGKLTEGKMEIRGGRYGEREIRGKEEEKNNLVVNPKAHMSFAVVILGLNKGKLIFHLREYIAEM